MKDNMKRCAAALALLLSAWTGVQADGGRALHSVRVNSLDMFRQDGRMNVAFEMDFSGIDLGRNEQVIYTPVLISSDGSQVASFGSIVLNGRNASIIEERSPGRKVADAVQTLRRQNGAPQYAGYASSVPYSGWMDHSTLYMAEDLCGCGELENQDRVELASFDNTPAREPLLTFRVPQAEQEKVRQEKGSAFVDFPVGRFAIQPDYRNNRTELGKILQTIDVVRNDPNVEITGITIHGHASPEGRYAQNALLAQNRTKALTDYVRNLYDIPADAFTMESTAEDWEGLRALVAGSGMDRAQEILSIIDDGTLDADRKEETIRSRYPEAYAFMKTEWYPSLRRSDYVISYVARSFTAREAMEVMETSPGQVSLYEMFLAAQTLDADSESYNKAMELGVRTYPDEPAANYNAAVVAVRRGDYNAARTYLSKVPESAETLNVKGVLALKGGDLDAARRLFQQSADLGLSEAVTNIETVDRMNVLIKQNR